MRSWSPTGARRIDLTDVRTAVAIDVLRDPLLVCTVFVPAALLIVGAVRLVAPGANHARPACPRVQSQAQLRGCRQKQTNVPLAYPPCHSRAISEGQSRHQGASSHRNPTVELAVLRCSSVDAPCERV